MTSKDSSSTSSSANSKSQTHQRNSRNRLGSFDYGKSGKSRLGTVTTHISALKTANDSDERDIGDMELGGITVQVGHVVEIEREGDVRSSVNDEVTSLKSTEDLVERS